MRNLRSASISFCLEMSPSKCDTDAQSEIAIWSLLNYNDAGAYPGEQTDRGLVALYRIGSSWRTL